MATNNETFTIKGLRKDHKIRVEKLDLSGVRLVTVYRDSTPILKCDPMQWAKFKMCIASL